MGATAYAYGIKFAINTFQVYTLGGAGVQSFTYNLPANQWTHVCGVISANPTALYINGALFGAAGPGGGVASNSADFWLGRSDPTNGEYFNGSIDDVRIYNRALSAGEVAYFYNSGATQIAAS